MSSIDIEEHGLYMQGCALIETIEYCGFQIISWHSASMVMSVTLVINYKVNISSNYNMYCTLGLGGTETFYLWLLWWDGHAIIANIAMSGLISQIIHIIRVNCAKLRQQCVLGAHVTFCCSLIHLSMIIYFLSKALIVQFFSNQLCKSAIILHTQYFGIVKLAAVLSIAHHSITF